MITVLKDKLPPEIQENIYVALDVEMFGMNNNQLHRPTSGKFACLTISYQPGEVFLITDPNLVPMALDRIRKGVWLIHNAKFDIVQLRRLEPHLKPPKLIDTMMMERELWNGYYDKFGLDSLARRYLDVYLDKSFREKFITATELTPELIQYSVDDMILLPIWTDGQRKHVKKSDMQVYREIDLPAMWALLDFQGIRLDVDAWRELAVRNKEKQLEADKLLPFNPRSNVVARNWYRKTGFKDIPNNQEDTLKKYVDKYPDTEAARLARIALTSKKHGTWASKYGMKFLENYVEWDGDIAQIITDYWVIGAETGRMSASAPPMHGIPSRETQDFRKCFIARPGNKFIKADWSQQEIMIAAWHSQDKKMIEICNSGKDIYILMADVMYSKSISKSDPFRDVMKSVVLGSDYGLTKYGVARKCNISLDEAEAVINKFHKTFPGMAKYQERQKQESKQVFTKSGRRIHLNPYNKKCENNALNAPIQGGGADILKLSLSTLHRQWNFDYPFGVVEVTHDEIGLDVPEEITPQVVDATKEIMIDTANSIYPGMKFRVDVEIGNSWAKGD